MWNISDWQAKMSRENRKMNRILLVDDEYDITLVVRLVFEENGFG
jgi:hypothetical protein